MNEVIEMFRKDHKSIVEDLKRIHKSADWQLLREEAKDEDGEPELAIRIGVDINGDEGPSYSIFTGSPDYDQRHCEFCGEASIGHETKFNAEADETLENIVNQIMDQIAEWEAQNEL